MLKSKKIFSLILTVVMLATTFTAFADSNTNFNRNNAAWYAGNYATSPNPAYYNYSSVGGDCTNFASQVLRYGGISMTSRKSNPDNTADWYYHGANWPDRTPSWTDAHYFRGYFGNVNGVGHNHAYAMEKYSVANLKSDFSSIYYDAWEGDIVQWTTGHDGQTRHSMVVVGYSGGDLQVAYRNAEGYLNTASTSLEDFIDNLSNSDWITLLRIKNGS
ncbi:MAG: amidase domain-containing protein [Lachnospiraceae bacterium]|nr:amidase domain-containing protein [Lachnospiraceae bacterium]